LSHVSVFTEYEPAVKRKLPIQSEWVRINGRKDRIRFYLLQDKRLRKTTSKKECRLGGVGWSGKETKT